MAHRSKSFGQADTAAVKTPMAAGAMAFLLAKRPDVLDYNPEQVFSRHQISVTGLGGGSYNVNILQPGAAGFCTHLAGAVEGDTVMIESPLAQQIEIVISGAATGDPVVHLTSMPRMS